MQTQIKIISERGTRSAPSVDAQAIAPHGAQNLEPAPLSPENRRLGGPD